MEIEIEIAIAIASLLGPALVVLGLSVLLYAKSWQTLCEKWEHDHYLLFPIALIELVLGLLMVRLYNIWDSSLWVLVTLSGWAMTLEGVFYMLAPGSAVKAVLHAVKNQGLVYLSGVVTLAVGAVLTYSVYF